MLEREPADIDEARLRPHLRDGSPSRTQLLRAQARVLRLALDSCPAATLPISHAQGGDPVGLRGIPVIGAAAGASPGTQPERALLAAEERAA